jgi:hypothetical protein
LEYESPLNIREFKLSLESKRKYAATKNIKFTQFILPDKSVILREYLPFETANANRHWNSLKNYYYDLSEILLPEDYLKNDSKITSQAAVKAVSYVIFKTFKQQSFKRIKQSLLEKFTSNIVLHNGDLFADGSWSYDKDEVYERYSTMEIEELSLKAKDNVVNKKIAPEFAKFNNVDSKYLYNSDSISDRKALIICDKSIQPLFDAFTAYFREVFFYHDFWYFNKNLIDYIDFDVIIEIKSERFLDTAFAHSHGLHFSTVKGNARFIFFFYKIVEISFFIVSYKLSRLLLGHFPHFLSYCSSSSLYIEKMMLLNNLSASSSLTLTL